MTNYKQTFIYGFAIFSMFFGSGNLVFPLEIGQQTETQWLLGFSGLFLTGILLPFLGLFVIKLHKGNYLSFFSEAGPLARVVLPLFTLSLLGSFGVLPRCITVAYGGVAQVFPSLSLLLFSFGFSVVCFILCLKENLLIAILGKGMAPLLLICLLVLLVMGFIEAPCLSPLPNVSGTEAFQTGFLTGYHTMDLFAAFFFSALIFTQIQKNLPEATDKETLKAAVKSSLVGSALLTLIYLGFVFLGAHYKCLVLGLSPELILPTIAATVLGKQALVLVSIIILFSCLTTAVALNNIYAQYLCSLAHIKKTRFPLVLLGTTGVSFVISLMNFQGIARLLSPLLEVSYPAIILLTLLSIFVKDHPKAKKIAFYLTLALSVAWEFGAF